MKSKWSAIVIALFVALSLVLATMEIVAAQEELAAGANVYFNEVAWAGTEASSADEWFEFQNRDDTDVLMGGWTIVIWKNSGVSSTIKVPTHTVPANGLSLIERTADDATSAPADGIFVGWVTNTDLDRVELRDEQDVVRDVILDPWPAGTSQPRASMMLVDGEWITAAHCTHYDADGLWILGSPGLPNSAVVDPDSCIYKAMLPVVQS